MQSRIEVVYGMISVVPAILVVYVVDTIECAAEMAGRIILIDKAVLCPVAHHHDKACIEHRNDEDHQGCLEVDKATS